jgi:CheY-like chemotaxis protein
LGGLSEQADAPTIQNRKSKIQNGMTILLLSSDLMLASAAHGAANRHGAELRSGTSAAAAVAACQESGVHLVVVDLRTPGLDIGALAASLKQLPQPPHILSCAPHVHEASLSAARAAGCDEVVSRGEVERRLDAAIQRLAHT